MAEPRADTRALEAETARALRGLFGRDTLYVVIWAVQVVVAALCIPILTRLLGPYRYGMVASSIAVMQVLVALGGAGLQTAVQWQFARSGERDARRLITLAMVVSALAFLVANATGPWWCARLGLGAGVPSWPRRSRVIAGLELEPIHGGGLHSGENSRLD